MSDLAVDPNSGVDTFSLVRYIEQSLHLIKV